MNTILNEVSVSTPGRICLFGEHQDYLGLPVIAGAINRRITVSAKRRNDKIIHFRLPDIHEKESFFLQECIPYKKERDYLRSVVNIVQRQGFQLSSGLDCKITGSIPINSGTSSSTALVVALTDVMIRMSEGSREISAEKVAKLAHQAEVVEFKEPGGMMDHYATALGGVIFLALYPQVKIEKLHTDLKSFVLGDSGKPKNTKKILSKVKMRIENTVLQLKKNYKSFSLHTLHYDDINRVHKYINDDQFDLLKATIKNRDLTGKAKEVFSASHLNHKRIGDLLYKHHLILSRKLDISTPQIDRMIEAALQAGAYGAKINGSGGGGCMFAYAPGKTEEVAEAIVKKGGKCYIIDIDEGTRTEKIVY
ncbi:MAG: galactokinase family protein [bacterium]